MKKYALYIICFLMAVATTSCKKEKEEDSFLKGQMTDFHGQKAYIDGSNYSCFRQGETIFVNGRNNCTVSALSNSDRTCTISGAEEANGYYAFYPANMISATDISSGFSGAMVTLPRVQQYVEESGHQVIDNPMAGHLTSPSGTIQFYNLCALLKVNVTSNWTLDSIQVTMKGTDLWGTGSVDTTNWKIDMDNGASHDTKYETVSLVFPRDGISTSNGMSFYIMVPNNTITADNQAVKVHFYGKYNGTPVHKNYSMSANEDKPLNYNKIIKLKDFSVIEYGIGVFTVAEAQNGQPARKVSFSQRRLINVGNSGTYTVDGYSFTGISNYDRHFFNNGDYVNTTIGGYPSHTWRTPTYDDWYHILNRPNNNNYAKALVGGHMGLIIFPDGWTPKNSNANPYKKFVNRINTNGTYYNNYATENITATHLNPGEWGVLENEGCIFLRAFDNSSTTPNNSDPGSQVDNTNVCGYFACASGNKILYFSNSNLGWITIGSYKVNVRMVHDLPTY